MRLASALDRVRRVVCRHAARDIKDGRLSRRARGVADKILRLGNVAELLCGLRPAAVDLPRRERQLVALAVIGRAGVGVVGIAAPCADGAVCGLKAPPFGRVARLVPFQRVRRERRPVLLKRRRVRLCRLPLSLACPRRPRAARVIVPDVLLCALCE